MTIAVAKWLRALFNNCGQLNIFTIFALQAGRDDAYLWRRTHRRVITFALFQYRSLADLRNDSPPMGHVYAK